MFGQHYATGLCRSERGPSAIPANLPSFTAAPPLPRWEYRLTFLLATSYNPLGSFFQIHLTQPKAEPKPTSSRSYRLLPILNLTYLGNNRVLRLRTYLGFAEHFLPQRSSRDTKKSLLVPLRASSWPNTNSYAIHLGGQRPPYRHSPPCRRRHQPSHPRRPAAAPSRPRAAVAAARSREAASETGW